MKPLIILIIVLLSWQSRSAAKDEATIKEIIKAAPFGEIKIYKTPQVPDGIVLFLSGNQGWSAPLDEMAKHLVKLGYWIAGIDASSYLKSMGKTKSSCFYIAGDLENLSKHLQKKFAFKDYLHPIVVGYESGATLSYLAYAQAPKNTFAGAISLNFCSDLSVSKKPCKIGDLKFTTADKQQKYTLSTASHAMPNWITIQGTHRTTCASFIAKDFVGQIPEAQFNEISAGSPIAGFEDWLPSLTKAIESVSKAMKPAALGLASVSDLPLIENIPDKVTSDFFVIFLSGDGGWAGIDSSISNSLVNKGVPVIGLNSLRYFWKDRNAKMLSNDLARLILGYSEKFKIKKYKLVGFSFGADVLPFAYNLFSGDVKKQSDGVVLLGLSLTASFEFHFQDWLHDSEEGQLTVPEIQKMSPLRPLCIYGDEEKDSACTKINDAANVISVSGGHHLGSDYDLLAQKIIDYRRK